MERKDRRGRKTKFSEPLEPYSIMIRRDQREYLKERENASDWVREAIDEKIERESGEVKAVDIVAVSKRITFLEQRIQTLKKTPEYERAMNIVSRFTPEGIKLMREQLAKKEKGMEFYFVAGDLMLRWGEGLLFGKYRETEIPIPGWTTQTLTEFLYKHHIITAEEEEIPSEYVLMIIDKMEEDFPYQAKVVEAYEKRVIALQAEISELKKKITE